MSRQPSPLKFLHPGWFSLVMGLCGLALAWHVAGGVLGPMASGVSVVLGLLAAAVLGDCGFVDVNLGSITPPAVLLNAARHYKAKLVWISVSTAPASSRAICMPMTVMMGISAGR